MRAAFIHGNKEISVADVAKPTPGPGEALVQLVRSGIGANGREAIRYYSSSAQSTLVPAGHEAAGIVEAIGDGVSEFEVGARVAIHPYFAEPTSFEAVKGWPQYAAAAKWAGTDLPGSWADYQCVPAEACVRIPDGVNFDAAAICASSGATALQALERINARGGETLLVFGFGSLGSSATCLAIALGLKVVVAEGNPSRQAMARSVGAIVVDINGVELDPDDGSIASPELRDALGIGPDVILDGMCTDQSVSTCVRVARVGTRYCMVGEETGLVEVPLLTMLLKQLTVIGSWSSSRQALHRVLSLVDRLDIHLERLVTHQVDLDEIAAAYELYETRTTGKILIRW